MPAWSADDIEISVDDELSGGSVVTVQVTTPGGEFQVIGEIEAFAGELVLAGVHIQSENVRRNSLGWPRLRQIVSVLAEMADVDAIVVKGAARTTGAGPGRIPRELRFARKISPHG